MNAHEVLVHTRDRLPAPFAQLAGELLFELDAAQPDHVRAFLIQIDLFEATVAFFSFLQLAELEARQLAITHSESAITALRDNPRITTGYWWSLLRESSRDLGTQPDGPRHGASRLVQQLLFDETGQSTAFSRVLDSVPGIRNRIKGHAWTLPLERYATESDRLLELTVRYLHALEGLADFCMFEIVSSTPAGGGFDCDSLVFVGDTRRPSRARFSTERAVEVGHVCVASRREMASGQLDGPRILDLSPFVQIRRDAGREDIALLQAIDEEASLLTLAPPRSLRCATTARNAIARLDRILARSRRTRDEAARLWTRFRDVAAVVLSNAIARASYTPSTYLVRRRLVDQVDEMVAKPGALLVTGPSGSGKTAFSCNLVDRWRASERADRGVVLIFASDLSIAGSLDELWSRTFEQSFDKSLEIIRAEGAQLILVVDGLDQVARSEPIAHQLAEICKRGAGVLSLVATGPEAVAPTIERLFAEHGVPLAVSALPQLTPHEVRNLFSLLRAGRTLEDLAIGSETLSTPLLVRIAATASRTQPTAGGVLLELLDRSVFHDPVKSHIVMKLAGVLASMRTKSAPLKELLAMPELGAAILTAGESSPLRQLVDSAILVVQQETMQSSLPVPREMRIGFAFDQLLEYILFADAVRARPSVADLAARLGDLAQHWPPAIGALRFWVFETTAHEAPEHVERVVVELLARLSEPACEALLLDLLAAQRPHDALARAIARIAKDEKRSSLVARAALAAIGRLERRCEAEHALRVCEVVTLALEHDPNLTFEIELHRANLEIDHVHADVALDRAERLLVSARTHAMGLRQELEALDLVERAARAAGARTRRYAARAEIRGLIASVPLEDATSKVLAWLAIASDEDESEEMPVPIDLAATAAELGRPSLLFRVRVRDALTRMRRRGRGVTERQEIFDGLLEAARSGGSVADEARALRILVRFWHDEPEKEERLLERAIALAIESRDPIALADLHFARAVHHLRVGRFADADMDAQHAEGVFARLGHRVLRLKVLQHVLAMCAWEVGTPDQLRSRLEAVLDEALSIESFYEATLALVLLTQVYANLGRLDQARAHLLRAAEVRERTGAGGQLSFDIARGWICLLEGNVDEARAAWRSARARGDAERFSDFVFQPTLLIAWTHVLEAQQPATEALEATRAALSDLLAGANLDRRHLDRYAGEIQSLYGLAYALAGAHEEAQVWIDRAASWLAAHPSHRSTVTIRSIEALLPELEARTLEQKKGAQNRVAGLRRKARERMREHVLPPLQALVATCDPAEAADFVSHHFAIRLLALHGLQVATT